MNKEQQDKRFNGNNRLIPIHKGDRYGHLVVIEELPIMRYDNGDLIRRVKCLCDCGNECIIRLNNLRRRRNIETCSCGCVSYRYSKHKQSKTKLFTTWQKMRYRCTNPNNSSYHNYGGRGIKVCDEWQSFETFANWAKENGYKENLEIDRINVNGNYCPENCRWATRQIQNFNKRNSRYITYNGVTKHLKEWSKETGLAESAIWGRYKKHGITNDLFKESKRNRKI